MLKNADWEDIKKSMKNGWVAVKAFAEKNPLVTYGGAASLISLLLTGGMKSGAGRLLLTLLAGAGGASYGYYKRQKNNPISLDKTGDTTKVTTGSNSGTLNKTGGTTKTTTDSKSKVNKVTDLAKVTTDQQNIWLDSKDSTPYPDARAAFWTSKNGQ